jgi:hypothetical protein
MSRANRTCYRNIKCTNITFGKDQALHLHFYLPPSTAGLRASSLPFETIFRRELKCYKDTDTFTENKTAE